MEFKLRGLKVTGKDEATLEVLIGIDFGIGWRFYGPRFSFKGLTSVPPFSVDELGFSIYGNVNADLWTRLTVSGGVYCEYGM